MSLLTTQAYDPIKTKVYMNDNPITGYAYMRGFEETAKDFKLFLQLSSPSLKNILENVKIDQMVTFQVSDQFLGDRVFRAEFKDYFIAGKTEEIPEPTLIFEKI